jgi:hypothetical protein
MKRRIPRSGSIASAIVGISLATTLGVAGVAGAATTTTTTPPAGRGAFGGASGSVAALSGTSMEVQNAQSGQVTVSWTTSTAFSQTVTVPASAVTVGACITATGSSSKSTITARSVTISQPVSGKCAAGALGARGGFGGAGRPAGSTGGRTFTPPSGGFRGTGAGGGAGRFPGAGSIAFASGKVTATSSTTLTVSGFSSASLTKAASTKKPAKKSGKSTTTTKPAKRPTIKTVTLHVKIASSTTYSETQSAASTNLAVGDCVTATGTPDSTGAVTASTVRITSTGGQSCTTGFGGGGFGGGGTGRTGG